MSDLASALVRLRASQEAYMFVYCAADATGHPALLVAPGRIDPRALFTLRTTAQDPRLVRGEVRYDDAARSYVFQPSTASHPQLQAHLQLVFVRQFPGLHSAQIAATPGEV